jgi:hypothetical protein
MRKWLFFCLGAGIGWNLVLLWQGKGAQRDTGGPEGDVWRLRDEAELHYPEEMFVGALQEAAPDTEMADLLDQVNGTSGLAGR